MYMGNTLAQTHTHTLLTQYALCTVTHIRHTLSIVYNISFKMSQKQISLHVQFQLRVQGLNRL